MSSALPDKPLKGWTEAERKEMTVDELREAIPRFQKLKDQMVGTLYPSIMANHIVALIKELKSRV